MGQMTIEVGPEDLVTTKNTDGQGRLFLGKDYADKRVRAVVEVVGEKEQALSDNPESAEKEEQDATHSEQSESDSEDSEKDVTPTDEDSEEQEGDTSSWLDAGEESGDSSE